MTRPKFDRAELLKKNPKVDVRMLSELEATLSELDQAGVKLFHSRYLLDPALGPSARISEQPTSQLLNQSLGE
jgi:hypothetical protein